MRAEEQFDSFYLKTRRGLVHQTFALTGDLSAAQRAVHRAYVAGWHHWRKVSSLDDPRDWVRPRAWTLAQRRHTARLWHRTKNISPEARGVLDALHKVPVGERRVLLLVQLAKLPLDVVAREVNAPQVTVERHLAAATHRFTAALGIVPAEVPAALRLLADAAAEAPLPRPATVRREGRRRRLSHAVMGVAAATVIGIASGAVAHEPSVTPPPEEPVASSPDEVTPAEMRAAVAPEEALFSAQDLLQAGDLRQMVPGVRWEERSTHDNTSGHGINTICQQERFADPDGLAALVRTFRTAEAPARVLVQTVEISRSPGQARTAYDTVLSWFSGCTGGDVHLEATHTVGGVGDQAALFDLVGWTAGRPKYTVAVARAGQVVTTHVLRTRRGAAPSRSRTLDTLATATQRICVRMGQGDCVARPSARLVPPMPSGEERGILSSVDLPGLPGVDRPWTGTSPAAGKRNPAVTPCEAGHFRRWGAVRTRTRTFLVFRARLPARFGLTETYGTFATPRAAAAFLDRARRRMSTCEDRDLATRVLAPRSLVRGSIDASIWRLETELSENRDVVFHVGFARHGRSVAQVTFVPAGDVDLPAADFRGILMRAGQRLAEIG